MSRKDPVSSAAGSSAGLISLTGAVFVAVTTELLPLGLMTSMTSDLNEPESRIGFLVTSYAVVVALAALPLTRLTSALERKHLLIGALLGYTTSNFVVAAAQSYSILIIARLIGGLSHAIFFSIVTPYAARLVIEKPGRAVAIVSAGIALASIVGVPAGSAVGVAYGWRSAFVITGVGGILAVVAATLLVPNLHRRGDSHSVRISPPRRWRGIATVALTTWIVITAQFTLYTYVTPLLENNGIDAFRTSVVLFGIGIAGLIGLVAAGATVDRHPRAAIAITISWLGLSLLTMVPIRDASFLTSACIAWGIALGALSTLFNAAALREEGTSPDMSTAAINAAYNFGIAGGALIGALTISLFGIHQLPLAAGALSFGGLASLRLWSRLSEGRVNS